MVILTASDQLKSKGNGLRPILQEKIDGNYLIVIEKDKSPELTQKLNM